MSTVIDPHCAAEVSDRICEILCDVAGEPDLAATNDAWTTKILSAVTELGSGRKNEKGKGIWVYASKAPSSTKDGSEWVFDLCWLDYESEERGANLYSVPLAMEVEWGNEGDIIDDFEKLLISHANLKVIIFQATNEKKVTCMVKTLQKLTESFLGSRRNDTYLFCGYDNQEPAFRFWKLANGKLAQCHVRQPKQI